MSHFAVLVIGNDPEKQLAPYQENNMGDCPEEYLEFNDIESEYKEKYENESSPEWWPDARKTVPRAVYNKLANLKVGKRCVVNVTGIIFDKVERGNRVSFMIERSQVKDDEKVEPIFTKCLSILESDERDPADACTTGKILVEIIEAPKHIPHKEKYATFQEFMKEDCKYEPDEEGKYGYWENPNAKWDWYQLGGRWTGFFEAKSGVKTADKAGSPGIMTPAAQPGRIDQGLKSEIDFMAMYDKASDEAGQEYDEISALFGGEIPKLDFTWDSTWADGNPYKSKAERVKAYDAQPACVALEELKQKFPRDSQELTEMQRNFLHGFRMGPPAIESFQCTRTEYQGKAINNSIVTYAVIKDGEWYQKGDMGWWGMSSNEKDPDEWAKEFRKLIDEASDDTLFSLYDCHI